jgi:hypothetical protein
MALTATQRANRRWKSISCGDAADTTRSVGTVKFEATSQPGQVHPGELTEGLREEQHRGASVDRPPGPAIARRGIAARSPSRASSYRRPRGGSKLGDVIAPEMIRHGAWSVGPREVRSLHGVPGRESSRGMVEYLGLAPGAVARHD